MNIAAVESPHLRNSETRSDSWSRIEVPVGIANVAGRIAAMTVSVWIGQAGSWDELDRLLTFHYTEDGDAIPTSFCQAFDIDWYDDDYREASIVDSPVTSIRELLTRNSHGAAIAEAIIRRRGEKLPIECYAVVLLYDFVCSSDEKSFREGEVSLQFYGCYEFVE